MGIELTFESIAAAGRAIVEAHKKKKGFEHGIRRLLSELYPDNAHFIYELLQNAEDAKASVVDFELYETSLNIRHNGSRPFSLNDIDSITNIGDSTKKDDPTQIGKFGVGFKAVYSYTSRPEIRSGPYSFAIENLFINERISGKAPLGWTSFRLPFNREDKPADVAVEEVSRGLEELDEKTLLFLNHIRTVTYTLPDGTVGIIERQHVDEQIIKIQKSEGEAFAESHWLRLVGGASVEHNGDNPLSVAAAFRLELGAPVKPKHAKQKIAEDARTRSLVPLEHGDVSIYFPAVKESSGLKFHIHAPFASTVARDSVRDDPGNTQLVADIGTLIVSSLPWLQQQGMINDSFLATLPNHDDPIARPYNVIREAITQAFNDLDITPARGSGYAPAVSLVASPGEFRNWLTEDDLQFLLGMADTETDRIPRWIRDRDGRAGKFLSGLDTIEFGWPEMEEALDRVRDVGDPDDPFIPDWLDWLMAKDDEAIGNLYQLLGRGRSSRQLGSHLNIPSIPLIRLTRRGKAVHVKGPDTYLPADRSDNVETRVPVNLSYFDDDEDEARANNLKALYNAAGVRRWNESARIETRLNKYRAMNRPILDEDSLKKHLDDVRAFARYAVANPGSAKRLFKQVPFLASPRPDGSVEWISPGQSYLDVPYRKTGLSSLHPMTPLAGQYFQPYPVAGYYLEIDGFEDFLGLSGSSMGIEIVSSDVFKNPQLMREWWVNNRHSAYTEETDWDIKDLSTIVAVGDSDLLRTLWQAILQAKPGKAEALYRANNSAPRYAFESQLAQKLKSKAWILDKTGALRRPREVTLDDLPDGWEQPSPDSLVHRLDFGAEATQRRRKTEGVTAYLQAEGLPDDGIDFLRELTEAGLTTSQLRDLIKHERAKSHRFPESASDNPERRSLVAATDAATAPKYKTELRLRSVVDGRSEAASESKGYLRGHYTGNEGEMFCQACHKPLPFKVGGQWYFESVRFISGLERVHTANALALCPLCAALYKHACETSNDALHDALANIEVKAGEGVVEVPLILNGELVRLRFTGKHAIDLQAALCVAGDKLV